MEAVRTYGSIARLAFRRQVTYRAATLAGITTNFFFGLLRASVMAALYGTQAQVAGVTLAGAITYTGVSQATIAFLSLFGWYDIMRSVYSGEVSSDLLKPVSYFGFWMAQDLGRALPSLFLRGVPIMVFYALVFGITLPAAGGQYVALALALLLGWMVSFAWRFLVNLSAFWVPNAVGIGRLAFTLSWFMSGFLMPLRFLPEWFQAVCYLTPFPHMINTVVEIYLGVLPPDGVLLALLHQALWFAGLALLGQAVLRMGVRRLVIQGG